MFYCMICKGEVQEARARGKKARTCSNSCQTEYRNRMRQERAEKKCRLCGRAFRQKRQESPVLHQHNEITEGVTACFFFSSSRRHTRFIARGQILIQLKLPD